MLIVCFFSCAEEIKTDNKQSAFVVNDTTESKLPQTIAAEPKPEKKRIKPIGQKINKKADVHVYDKNGFETEWTRYKADGSYDKIYFKQNKKHANKSDSADYKFTFKFNKKGQREQWISHADDGTTEQKFTYKYDDKGNETEWVRFNSKGINEEKNVYTYDEKGRKTEWNHYNAQGVLEFTYYFTYDINGNQSQELKKHISDEQLFKEVEIK